MTPTAKIDYIDGRSPGTLHLSNTDALKWRGELERLLESGCIILSVKHYGC